MYLARDGTHDVLHRESIGPMANRSSRYQATSRLAEEDEIHAFSNGELAQKAWLKRRGLV
jgi:hypothetical protein